MRRRHHGERGAALVEFALLLPLLALILMGTITGGLALSRQNSVKNSVREATRFGAVAADFDDPTDSLSDLYKQVVASATGDLNPSVADRIVCVALINEDDEWDYQLYRSSDSPTVSASGAALSSVDSDCKDGFDATVGDGTRRIWVRAYRTSKVDAILYSGDWELKARSLTRYER